MKDKAKSVLNFGVRFGLSGVLLYFVFSKIDIGQTIEVIKSADVRYIIYGFLAFVVINFLLFFRWTIFIKALNLTVNSFQVVRLFCLGLFGNSCLPSAMGGDIFKIVGLCKNSDQKPRVIASVLLDRLSGFSSIVIVAVFSFIFGIKYINNMFLAIPIALMALGSVMIIMILFNEPVYEFGCRMFNRFPKVKKSLMNLHYDIVLLKDNKLQGFFAIGLACAGQLIYAYSFYLVSKGLHQEIALIYFFVFVPMICVASSVPSIGGLGVREFGAVALFSLIGIDEGVAASLSLISGFLYVVILALLGGLFYVVTLSSGRVQHNPPDPTIARAEA